jgi:hypothetical protein
MYHYLNAANETVPFYIKFLSHFTYNFYPILQLYTQQEVVQPLELLTQQHIVPSPKYKNTLLLSNAVPVMEKCEVVTSDVTKSKFPVFSNYAQVLKIIWIF